MKGKVMETINCPECGTTLFEDENLRHDGYMGSAYAHNGRGSYGTARHHFYFICPCGWSERPSKKCRKRKTTTNFNFNGVKLPLGIANMSECVVLSCRSRQTQVEKLAEILAEVDNEIGVGTRHSLLSSYTHIIVPKTTLQRAQKMIETRAFRGCKYSWEFKAIIDKIRENE